MKKIFAIVAIVATMILSASCGCRQTSAPVEDAVEVVDSLSVAVDSLSVATDSLVVEAPAEEVAE